MKATWRVLLLLAVGLATPTAALGDGQPSILALFEGMTPGARGRFELELRQPGAMTSGTWWVLDSGEVYTAFDLDRAFVEQEIASLRARRERLDPAAALQIQQADLAAEFQLPLLDLLHQLGVAPAIPAGWAKLFASTAPACAMANDSLIARAADELALTPVRFTPRGEGVAEWVFPVAAFEQALDSARQALNRDCESMADGWSPKRSLRFERSLRKGNPTLSVFYDAGDSASVNEQLYFVLALTRGAPVPKPPEVRSPRSLFEPVSRFLLKVHECRGLPWEYATFAASHSWTSPGSYTYSGPTVLSGRFHCEAEVLGGVATWGSVAEGRSRAEGIIRALAEIVSSPTPSGHKPDYSTVFDSLEESTDTCLRLGLGNPPVGPVRLRWRGSDSLIRNADAAHAPSPDRPSFANFAEVSFAPALERQHDALVEILEQHGFRSERTQRSNGLVLDALRLEREAESRGFFAGLTLRAQRLSDGRIRTEADFNMGTPCLDTNPKTNTE